MRKIFGLSPLMIVAVTWILLLLGKSLGPILYGVAGTLLVLFATPKRQMLFAVVVAGLVLAYPILRAESLVPTETLLNMANVVSSDREGSLRYRLETEELLLERARQRIWFGWGSWGRNRVYDEATDYSPATDGLWAIVLGMYGVVGFVGHFGLLTVPVLLAASRLRRLPDPKDRILTAGVTLLVAVTALDSIPNVGGGGPPSLFLAGALSGVAEGAKLRRRSENRVSVPAGALAAGSGAGAPRTARIPLSPPVAEASGGAAPRPRGIGGT
jgi:cell division protein FtsW (lipid II flippase)